MQKINDKEAVILQIKDELVQAQDGAPLRPRNADPGRFEHFGLVHASRSGSSVGCTVQSGPGWRDRRIRSSPTGTPRSSS